MFLVSSNEQALYENLSAIGLKNEINNNDVLIKINLSGVYQKNLPRTDMTLLKIIVNFIYRNGGRCAIAEGARGNLTENLIASGFEDTLKYYTVRT